MVVRQIASYLDEVTEKWIGWTFPPVEQAIDLSGWQPDDRDTYCDCCGDSVGVGESTERGCATCREGAELDGGIGDGIVRLGPYVEELRDWILKIKYECWAEMGHCLGELLGKRLLQFNGIDREKVVVVPMPMPWQRRLYRGIDHAQLIGASIASVFKSPVVNVLKRSHHTPQVALSPSERKRAGSRGMRVRFRLGGWKLHGAHVLLVDDVRTTGATLKSAVRLLRQLKPERIVCAVLGVSDSKARLDRGKQHRGFALKSSTGIVEPERCTTAVPPASPVQSSSPSHA